MIKCNLEVLFGMYYTVLEIIDIYDYRQDFPCENKEHVVSPQAMRAMVDRDLQTSDQRLLLAQTREKNTNAQAH